MSKPSKPNVTKDKKGISMEELLGIRTIPVISKKADKVRISGQEELRPAIIGTIMEGKFEDIDHKWGLITQDVVEAVLESAERNKEGDIIVKLPEPSEKEITKGITWVNYL